MKTLWRRLAALFAVVSLLASSVGLVPADAEAPQAALTDITTQTAAADAAIDWLLTQIQPDGSFPIAFGHPAGMTCDAALAGVAALKDVSTWNDGAGGASPIAYLELNASNYITSSLGAAGKLATTVVSLDLDPWQFGGENLQEIVDAQLAESVAQSGPQTSDLAWSILGLAAMRRPIGADGPAALLANQNADGGWGWALGQTSDADSTAIALQALAASGWAKESEESLSGLGYLANHQTGTGGWGWGSDSASSTAYVLQALLVSGEDPTSGGAYDQSGATPLSALLSLQMPSGGFPGWTGAEDVMTTAQAIPGLVGRPLPIPGVVPALVDAVVWLMAQQEDDGSYGDNTAVALMAIVSAGEDPRSWKSADGVSLIDAIENADHDLDNVGAQGRAAMALTMAGENPNLCGETNLIGEIASSYQPMTGAYSANANIYHQVYAMWAMTASDVLGADAAQWLADQQNADGGWGWAAGQDSDSNSTAIAIEALISAEYTDLDQVILDGMLYLKSVQSPDGGFMYNSDTTWGNDSDTDSTSVSLQALYACGVAPQFGWDYAVVGESGAASIMIVDPETRLLGLQSPTGAFEWKSGFGDNAYATMEAIPAMARRAFPVIDGVLSSMQDDIDWIMAEQEGDGSFGGSAGLTVDALLAGIAAGRDAGTWQGGAAEPTALEYLESEAAAYATSASDAGKLAVGAVAAGAHPRAFGGVNLEQLVLEQHDGAGSLGLFTADAYWGILGLEAMGTEVPALVVDVLKSEQAGDGGWGWQLGEDSDADTTAYVLQALMAAGVPATDPAVIDALAFLETRQVAGGGFESGVGWGASPNTTAVVIQALVACGESLKSAPWGSVDGDNPVKALYAMRMVDGAYPGWQGTADVSATAQSITGLLTEPLPLLYEKFEACVPLVFQVPAN